MFKVRFWCVLSVAVWVSSTSCASSSPRERAAGAPAETVAQTPQPEDPPCADCRLSAIGRVTGTWQKAMCVSASVEAPGKGPFVDVVFPVSDPRVEVIEGEPSGTEFPLAADSELEPGATFEGKLDEGAAPKSWVKAVLWVTDSEGKRCGTLLAIDK